VQSPCEYILSLRQLHKKRRREHVRVQLMLTNDVQQYWQCVQDSVGAFVFLYFL
jgi:hypothetical protein